ncbi:isoleucine--tRNA ligase [Blattabacterium cuenoti]|uniref:isoleucine--tRNA ligase n=1 Tax=Blattabacterium cuenoti TaxID=1653831 RepID=UPI00163C3735|nr:isoleucine--tRNA ligase [Blattabacterium cuenoti]
MSIKFLEYKTLNLNEIDKEIYQYWKRNKILKKSFQSKKNKNISIYTLYEGPPSLNGKPGLHHIVARTIKDIFGRYHTLKGKKVIRKAGWDTHGLPIEINVEKKLGITKNDIGKNISVKDYNKICFSFVQESMKEWIEFTDKIGYWIDMENSFITYKTKYIESVWWLIKKLYQKKILYKDYTIQPYSPAAGTGLSHHELNMPGAYKKIEQISPILKFKVKKETLSKKIQELLEETSNLFLLSWTTTPWTLPSNTALAIGSNIDYVLVKIYNFFSSSYLIEYILFARKLIHKILQPNKFYSVSNYFDFYNFKVKVKEDKIPYFVIGIIKGKDLVKSRYEQLISWFKPYKNKERAFQIIEGDEYVNTKEGTGIVHIAPTFGIEDLKLAKKYNIPSMLILNQDKRPIPLVDVQGRFLKSYPHQFGGRYIKNSFEEKNTKNRSVDQDLVTFLNKENKIFKVEKYTHFYPHCWRTEKPIIYYPLDSWFINTKKMKDKMVFLNKKINWFPKNVGKKRFESWLNNLKDWNLSRSRYWGTPLPIWRTKNGKEELIIGSIQELFVEINKSIKHGFMSIHLLKNFVPNDMENKNYDQLDLHKHFLDQIILVSSSGKPMMREPDLIDVWFDSGSMPYAQFHYPFENKKLIDNNIFFPADFIAEGIDQTRGWFFTLHAISSILFNSIAYKNVVSTGLVLDEKGQKMSKSKGNTIDPISLIDNYGADSIRWYIIFNSEPWDNLKFNKREIDTGIKKFFGTLYNIYSFFVLYANIDDFSYKEKNCYMESKIELDVWILSELNTMIKKVDGYYAVYNPTKAARLIFSFVVDKLSNWYIRLCRRRFWKEEYNNDKISAYQILYNCLITISKLISPITPFFSEKLYIDLNSITKKETFESVHLSSFPRYDSNLVNSTLEKLMIIVQRITKMAFSIRKKNGIKIRQPLQKILVFLKEKKILIGLKNLSNILLKEINVKKIEFLDSPQNSLEFIKRVHPNYKMIGPKFGNKTHQISDYIKNFSPKKIQEIESGKNCSFFIDGEKIVLSIKDVKITTEVIKNWSILFDNELTIALDLNITDSLREDYMIRELIRTIQQLRKKSKYNIVDRILTYISPLNRKMKFFIQNNKDHICKETLSERLFFEEKIGKGIKIPFGEEEIYIFIQRVSKKNL